MLLVRGSAIQKGKIFQSATCDEKMASQCQQQLEWLTKIWENFDFLFSFLNSSERKVYKMVRKLTLDENMIWNRFPTELVFIYL